MQLDYLSIQIGQTPPEIEGDAPFKCILVVNGKAQEAWRGTISQWLVSAGCLYLMVWGEDAEVWHDGVDQAHLKEFDFGDVPDDRFVMTTWHDNESLEDVMFFAKFAAMHPTIELSRLLVLDVGHTGRSDMFAELLASA